MYVVRAKLCHAQLLSLPADGAALGSGSANRGVAGRGRLDAAPRRLRRLSQPAQQKGLKAASGCCSGS